MGGSERSTWLVFAICSALVVVVLAGMSLAVLRLEGSEMEARAEAEYQESLRLSLWRMDSWMSIFLAREAARPHDDYITTTNLGPALPSQRIVTVQSEFLSHYFELDSPQGDSELDWQEPFGPSYLDPQQLIPALGRAEGQATSMLVALREARPAGSDDSQDLRSDAEFGARQTCSVPHAPGETGSGDLRLSIGPLIPVWLKSADEASGVVLVCVRRLSTPRSETLQGFVLDWQSLRKRLLIEVSDLIPQAELEPILHDHGPPRTIGRTLANIPATVMAPRPPSPRPPLLTPTRGVLVLTWLATLAAMATVASTLRTSLVLSSRQRRFVATVSHELRTPLTTFQMYSEMLATGVIAHPEARQEYLNTLRDESGRLSAMVENVLVYSQLEQGTSPDRVLMEWTDLAAHFNSFLTDRARSLGVGLKLDLDPDTGLPVEVDVAGIQRVLGNLLDNAAKYAGSEPKVQVGAVRRADRLIFSFRDFGPGITRSEHSIVFSPFERGAGRSDHTTPGVGLGLAVSQSLARRMGGELSLESPPDGGCLFILDLPVE